MTSIAQLLEEELEEAVEVKDKRSLHRYVMLLVEQLVHRSEYMTESNSIHTEIRALTETMREGFQRMDLRFEASDKRFEDLQNQTNARFKASDKRFEDLQVHMNARFEDVNRRFTMMFTFMSVGFTGLAVLMSLFKFLVP